MQSTTIRDISPSYWFGPLQPLKPSAPATYRPRQWAYNPGSNLIWQPKQDGDSTIDFDILRALADAWDLLRIVIETQKDRLCGVKFDFRHKEQPGETNRDRKQRNLTDPNVKALKEFFVRPDGIHPFKQWLRMWLEDMLVLDAVALYVARDKAGKAAAIHPIDGATINRCLTDQGFIPQGENDVAYQQVMYGTVAWDFNVDQLTYFMRNERTHRRYGYSPLEQIVNYTCFGLRRLEWQISEYTSGTVPESMIFLPNDLPIDRVKEIQSWFDSILAGDLGERRKVRFLPGYGAGENGGKPNIVFPKQPLLKDELDEWLARVICFCFGISPQPFIKMMNRATAQQGQEISEEEGKMPFIDSIESVLNDLIQRQMGLTDYEAVHQQAQELDVLKQAQADNLVVGKVYTINEVRERRGEDPRSEPEADMLGMFSPTAGFIPITSAAPNGDSGDDGRDGPQPKGKKPVNEAQEEEPKAKAKAA